ncbi:MAG: hypothetical protein M1814_000478 [Vezdaea aestivalis]|nr:MAG: hypothetical protein M1814_000478 [Vezdaea aestivalis]
MELQTWYAIGLGMLAMLRLVYYVVWRICVIIKSFTAYFLLKHLVYPHILPRIPFLGVATRCQTLGVALYSIANVLCMTIGVSTPEQVGARASLLSIANMIPLLIGPRLSLVSNFLELSVRSSSGIHVWIGRTAIAQAVVHMTISVVRGVEFKWDRVTVSGVVVSAARKYNEAELNLKQAGSAIAAIFFTSLIFIRGVMYELFLRSHFVLSVTIVVALWRHIKTKRISSKIYLWIGVSVWTLNSIVHWAMFIFRNFVFGHPIARAQISQLVDAIQIDLIVPRPWKIHAGQYIFLTIPGVGTWSALQSHPFMITWWNEDPRESKICLLVKPQRGFTSKLARNTDYPMRAFLDGPYGLRHKFGDFGTVLMFASGIGVAGQLPHVKELIAGYNNFEVRTRRIALFWQIDRECHASWVQQWMNELLEKDTDYVRRPPCAVSYPNRFQILQISLFILGRFRSEETHFGDVKKYGNHDRIEKIYSGMNVETRLDQEFERRRGRIMISTCANPYLTDRVRDSAQHHIHKNDRFVELEFQPPTPGAHVWARDKLDFRCRGA